MEWVAIGAGVCVVWWYLSARHRADQQRAHATEQRQAELYDLQFWEADLDDVPDDVFVSTRAHFPSMLLRCEFASRGHETLRLYRLRRRGDGVWERMFTDDSFELELDQKETSIFQDELAMLRKEGNAWRALDAPTLETAYQRFIHAQGVPVIDVARDWKREEAESHASERRKVLAKEAGAGPDRKGP